MEDLTKNEKVLLAARKYAKENDLSLLLGTGTLAPKSITLVYNGTFNGVRSDEYCTLTPDGGTHANPHNYESWELSGDTLKFMS